MYQRYYCLVSKDGGRSYILFGVKMFNFRQNYGLIEIDILSTNSMSVRGSFNKLTACSRVAFTGVTFYVRYKTIVKRSALEVDDGEVRQSSMYKIKHESDQMF